MRRRMALAAAGVALVAAVVLGVLALGGASPPEDTAARLVPATALVYAHLSTDPERDEDSELLRRLAEFPALASLRGRLTEAFGGSLDLGRDVRPWLGDEAALALLDTRGTRADVLLLLAVRDRAKAEAFLQRVAGSRGTTTHRGVSIRRFAAVSVAQVDGFMAVGQDSAVRAAIDRGSARGGSLATAPAYERVAEDRPDERVLDVVVPAEGVNRVLVPAPGALGALGGLLAHPELVAVSASLAGDDDGLRLHVRQARAGGSAEEFEPELLEEVPRAATAYLGIAGVEALGALVPAGSRAALGAALEQALAGASLDLERDVTGPLGEVAVSVTPGLPVPTVTLVARTSDEGRTREALARLQQPLAERLAPAGQGSAPPAAFEQREIEDVPAYALPIAAGVELTYAVADGRLMVSSQAGGVAQVLADREGLDESPAFERAVGDLPDSAEAILFLDLGQLLALAEQAGSTGDPTFDALRSDLRAVRNVGAVVRREENDSTAELFLEIP